MGRHETYKGKYDLTRPEKYKGDPDKVVFRSMWERQVMRWCEANENVEWFSSEELVIPYKCKTDGLPHRYFVDFVIKFKNGRTVIVEVKPSAQCKPPKTGRGRKKQVLNEEIMTWAKNVSKWEAAKQYAEKMGYQFQIWDEHTLRKLGIVVMKDWRKK